MGVQMSSAHNSPVKEGFVERYKSGFLSAKWKSTFARLYPDSTLALYNDRGDSRPAETVFLKNVVPYICVGFMTDRMPVRRPNLPPGTAVQRLVGIGMDAQASKVHWILFPSEQILEEWFNAIISTLPKPAQPQPNPVPNAVPPGPGGQPVPAGGGFVPPAKYPDAPPPYGAAQPAPTPPYAYPQQQPQQQPYYPPGQQTVIIDRTGAGGGYGSSSGFGTGLAAGMGGAMLGSLLGYGIGSMFAPHGGWGGWGGWGGGYGGYPMGGGFIQDNDTYVTNNYYVNNDNSNTDYNTPSANDTNNGGDYSTPAQNDYNDYDGGGGSWDDYGGGGGFDGGGGDW